MIAIIDYQAGNQTSVYRALQAQGLPAVITAEPKTIRSARGVIFPGVGAAGQAMKHLAESGLGAVIKELVAEGRPVLGICVGCQILLDSSEEDGLTPTLGILPGLCRKFDAGRLDYEGRPIRIPHMGWNQLRQVRASRLFQGLSDQDEFYFVHSYYPEPAPDLLLGLTDHGGEFCSAFGRDGLWAVQFHPEKSGPAGLKLLRNFYDYCLERSC